MSLGREQIDNQTANYLKVPNALWETDLSGSAVKVWGFIASQARDFHHSVDQIALRTRLATGTVKKALRELRSNGLLVWHKVRFRNSTKNIYTISLPTVSRQSESTLSNAVQVNFGPNDRSESNPSSGQKMPDLQHETIQGKDGSQSSRKVASEERISKSEFEALLDLFPQQDGRTVGVATCMERINNRDDFARLERAIRIYRNRCQEENTPRQFIKQIKNFVLDGIWLDLTREAAPAPRSRPEIEPLPIWVEMDESISQPKEPKSAHPKPLNIRDILAGIERRNNENSSC